VQKLTRKHKPRKWDFSFSWSKRALWALFCWSVGPTLNSHHAQRAGHPGALAPGSRYLAFRQRLHLSFLPYLMVQATPGRTGNAWPIWDIEGKKDKLLIYIGFFSQYLSVRDRDTYHSWW
jgi:hypothetical protein